MERRLAGVAVVPAAATLPLHGNKARATTVAVTDALDEQIKLASSPCEEGNQL